MSLKQIPPLSGAAPYIGGKRKLASQITPIIEKIPHDIYAEPFVGMGGIFFRRRHIPKHEVINDYSNEVINFFRVTQRHCRELLHILRFQLSSRTVFCQMIDTPVAVMTDIERAAKFFYLQKTCFGGKLSGKNYGVDVRRSRFNIRKLKKHLIDLHRRLSAVTVECLPYDEFICRYDRPGVLFYLDPPYWGCENDYGKEMFNRDDFVKLAEQLAGIRGKFLMSINDVPQIRDIFQAFSIHEVNTTYTIGAKNKDIVELIVTNTQW